jgi:predicted nucleotidyltransferase
MLNLTPEQLSAVKLILDKFVPNCEVRMFDSRLNAKVKKYADLDIAVVGKGKIPLRKLVELREAFEESDLPFRVDLLDWHRLSPEFKKIILAKCVVI